MCVGVFLCLDLCKCVFVIIDLCTAKASLLAHVCRCVCLVCVFVQGKLTLL